MTGKREFRNLIREREARHDQSIDYRGCRFHRLAPGRSACWREATRFWSSTTTPRGGAII